MGGGLWGGPSVLLGVVLYLGWKLSDELKGSHLSVLGPPYHTLQAEGSDSLSGRVHAVFPEASRGPPRGLTCPPRGLTWPPPPEASRGLPAPSSLYARSAGRTGSAPAALAPVKLTPANVVPFWGLEVGCLLWTQLERVPAQLCKPASASVTSLRPSGAAPENLGLSPGRQAFPGPPPRLSSPPALPCRCSVTGRPMGSPRGPCCSRPSSARPAS